MNTWIYCMGKWMNLFMMNCWIINEQMNQWMVKRCNGWMNYLMNELMDAGMNDWINEWRNRPSFAAGRLLAVAPGRTDVLQRPCKGSRWPADRWCNRCWPSHPSAGSTSPEQEVKVGVGGAWRGSQASNKNSVVIFRMCVVFFPPVVIMADFPFVDVNDALHQKIALQAVDAVPVHDYFMVTRWTAEVSTALRHGDLSLKQSGEATMLSLEWCMRRNVSIDTMYPRGLVRH